MYRLFFVLISLLVGQSFAADVANLYQSQIPVSSQSEQERQNVAPEALQQVILKVVGDRAKLDTVDISPLLAQTDTLVQQYQYQRINMINDDMTQPDRLEAVLSFNKVKLNSALSNLGLPIWGHNRPEVIIWLALDEGEKRRILSADDSDLPMVQALQYAAKMRGLPILFPVMDLQDQSKVTYTDLSAGFAETVEAASQRYGAPVILLVTAQVSDTGLHRANWHARINGQSEQWSSRGDTTITMQAGIDELTDRLARRFSQVETSQFDTILSLHISDVKNYADYMRIETYLKNLQNVSSLQLTKLQDETLTVNLSFNGEIAVFDRTLAIERVLIEQSLYSATNVKSYRLSL